MQALFNLCKLKSINIEILQFLDIFHSNPFNRKHYWSVISNSFWFGLDELYTNDMWF